MQAVSPVAGGTAGASTSSGLSQTADNAFGLSFESLLKIILTQLTYQDPLKPMDNTEFVSQLAQFSQIQQGQVTNDRLQSLVLAQSTAQATGLLGTRVDIPAGAAVLSGKVTSVSFSDGAPQITIETDAGQTISGIALSAIQQIRSGD